MADFEEAQRIGELAEESIAPIGQELRQRLGKELSERESLAIDTALVKAFINGMRTGSAEAAERVLDSPEAQTGLSGRREWPTVAQLDPELPWLDRWADRYGGG